MDLPGDRTHVAADALGLGVRVRAWLHAPVREDALPQPSQGRVRQHAVEMLEVVADDPAPGRVPDRDDRLPAAGTALPDGPLLGGRLVDGDVSRGEMVHTTASGRTGFPPSPPVVLAGGVKWPRPAPPVVTDRFPADPQDPRFVAAVAGVLATAALYAYAATADVLTTGTVSFVLLAVLLPTTAAYWLARRLF